MNRRSRAREVVLQVLFQDDLNPRVNPGEADQFVQMRLKHDDTYAFAQELIKGVRQNRPQLDAQLERIADNWSLVRMAVTDRNILRLGAFEILFTDTPDRVAINEAVELAKRFGAAQSPQFVNGILDRFLAGHGKPEVSGPANPPPASPPLPPSSAPPSPPLPAEPSGA